MRLEAVWGALTACGMEGLAAALCHDRSAIGSQRGRRCTTPLPNSSAIEPHAAVLMRLARDGPLLTLARQRLTARSSLRARRSLSPAPTPAQKPSHGP
ncbi:hypothetical protein K505DRAFT_327802 [Melanomma pulvis-pyrius CBS 109.77]|uniref:Uncharacterized protein n=1 Tax=Melanomma pulvis-pyrius CBS 109.77 TaxID=1314802 RepID=A0A6A6X1K1_9PLEO|nr:hypothetical protein K505DRAFT_327802 [Melanomma pulvis-pyrius CBS 109.77]